MYFLVLFIASVADALSEQAAGNQETMTIQQGGHTLYPAHVQYVDGNDPSIYASTNGQMYELTKSRCANCGAVMHGLFSKSNFNTSKLYFYAPHRVGGNQKRYQQSTNTDQKSIETVFSIPICCQ